MPATPAIQPWLHLAFRGSRGPSSPFATSPTQDSGRHWPRPTGAGCYSSVTNSSGVSPAWRKMFRRVPGGTSWCPWAGTVTRRPPSGRRNCRWPPSLAMNKARAMERGQHVTSRDDGQTLHPDASTVTMGVSLSGGGTGSPSATSPLMWQRMASSARSRASAGVAPNVKQPGSAGTDTFHALPSGSGSARRGTSAAA